VINSVVSWSVSYFIGVINSVVSWSVSMVVHLGVSPILLE
jgi:hypothetical protein